MFAREKSSESSEKSSDNKCLKGKTVQKVQKTSSESSEKSSDNMCLKGKTVQKVQKNCSYNMCLERKTI